MSREYCATCVDDKCINVSGGGSQLSTQKNENFAPSKVNFTIGLLLLGIHAPGRQFLRVVSQFLYTFYSLHFSESAIFRIIRTCDIVAIEQPKAKGVLLVAPCECGANCGMVVQR